MTTRHRLNWNEVAPAGAKALFGIHHYITRETALPDELIHLVFLRVSQINGCAHCVDLHSRDARKAGEDERRLATLPVWRETPFFSDRERAALEWTEALTLVAQDHVPDAVWQQVKPYFTPEEIVDLSLLVSAINVWNRFAIAFRKTPA